MNIENLRKAQRIVCEHDFEEYRGTDHTRPNEYHGCVDDHIWNRAQNVELNYSLEYYEKQFINEATYENALHFWMKSSISH